MIELKRLSKQLRLVADEIDKLLGIGFERLSESNENPVVARKIRKEFKSAKGFKYKPGTHWTQKPENKERLSRVVRKAAKTRMTQK